jgi:hypothetical protein
MQEHLYVYMLVYTQVQVRPFENQSFRQFDHFLKILLMCILTHISRDTIIPTIIEGQLSGFQRAKAVSRPSIIMGMAI